MGLDLSAAAASLGLMDNGLINSISLANSQSTNLDGSDNDENDTSDMFASPAQLPPPPASPSSRPGHNSNKDQEDQSSLQPTSASTHSSRPSRSIFSRSTLHENLQPGMMSTDPRKQPKGPSLGLALGGASFRRKPLFEADPEDLPDPPGHEYLTRSPQEDEGSIDGARRKSSRVSDEHPDQHRNGSVDEDGDSTVLLQRRELPRGLENQHESRTGSFLSRLGVTLPPTGMLSSALGSSHHHSPRLGLGPIAPGRAGNGRIPVAPLQMPNRSNSGGGPDSGSSSRSRGGAAGSSGPSGRRGAGATRSMSPLLRQFQLFGGRGSEDNGGNSGGGNNSNGKGTSTSVTDPLRQVEGRSSSSVDLEHDDEQFRTDSPSPEQLGGSNPYHDDSADWINEGTGFRVAYDDFTTIDWIHDFAQERQRIRRLHQIPGIAGQMALIYNWVQGWVVVLAVGIAAGIVAGGSDIASQWLGDIKEGYCSTAFYLNRNFCCWGLDETDTCDDWVPWNKATWLVAYIFYVLFALMFATTAAFLVKTYAPYAEGSGIPEVKTILGGFVIRNYLGLETLVIKTVTLILSTASGLSLGKEGPLVHISCCIGNIIPRVFPRFKNNEAKMREILSAAASAGISVAFGAPIGGVVFSLEELSYHFSTDTMWHSFFCAMAAAVALKLMDPFRTEKLVVFQVEYDHNWHGFEMIFYMLLGVLGGLWGAFFIRMNLKLAAFRKTSWLRVLPVYEVFLVTLATAVVGYLNIFTRVQSPELLASLFRECDGPATNYHGLCDDGGVTLRVFSLLTASGIKGVLTIVTFGLAIPAGIFMPSMVIGALFGRALGIVVQAWQANHQGFWLFAACAPDVPCVTPGSYAMVGAAAFMGGVTRMTVSLVIIMFELTGALTYVLPIMIVVMTSKWVGDAFGKEGIFDGIILLCGYPFLGDKEEYKYNTMASQVMTPVEDLVVITATGNTLDSLDNLLRETDYKGYPVVSSLRDMMLVGYISRTELRYALDEARKRNLPGSTPVGNVVPILESTPAFIELRLWMDQTPITVSHRFPMDQIIVIFRKLGVRYVLCTQHGQLLGLITKKDVLRHLALIEHPDEQESGALLP
ncbi:hypothetical protein BGW42_002409 [Actinomortierella wolfii]|nr:hypothetical protein BGW42_002409 [Actinomortierella wolfii]